jgi:hypothetical protein
MTTYQKAFSLLRNALFASFAICLLSRCQDNELASITKDTPTEAAAATEVAEPNVASITITGTNTVFTAKVDCKTCTFVVSDKLETIDGKALGLKPGSVICLDAALKYGHISFENLDGTAEQPITIGNCGN